MGGRRGLPVARSLGRRAPRPSPRALPLTPAPQPRTQRRTHVTALLGDGEGGAPVPAGGRRPRDCEGGRGTAYGWWGNRLQGRGILPPRPSAPRPRGEGALREGGPSCRSPRHALPRRPGARPLPRGAGFPLQALGPVSCRRAWTRSDTLRLGRAVRSAESTSPGFGRRPRRASGRRGRRGYRRRRSLAVAGGGGRNEGGAGPFLPGRAPGCRQTWRAAGASRVLRGGAGLGILSEEFTSSSGPALVKNS